jgi:hypothetical protein
VGQLQIAGVKQIIEIIPDFLYIEMSSIKQRPSLQLFLGSKKVPIVEGFKVPSEPLNPEPLNRAQNLLLVNKMYYW